MYSLFKICQRSPALIPTPLKSNLHTSPVLCGEPMKKKRRADPAQLRHQLDRQKKRLEKKIRLAARFSRKLKPVDEFELHRQVAKDSGERLLNPVGLDREEELRRAELVQDWAIYKRDQACSISRKFSEMMQAQETALRELKLENQELHDAAVRKDEDLLPYRFMGPCETPPISGYIQDGNYLESTKSYDLDPEIVKLMLERTELKKRKRNQ